MTELFKDKKTGDLNSEVLDTSPENDSSCFMSCNIGYFKSIGSKRWFGIA